MARKRVWSHCSRNAFIHRRREEWQENERKIDRESPHSFKFLAIPWTAAVAHRLCYYRQTARILATSKFYCLISKQPPLPGSIKCVSTRVFSISRVVHTWQRLVWIARSWDTVKLFGILTLFKVFGWFE